MPPSEEVSDASADVMIDGLVCPASTAVLGAELPVLQAPKRRVCAEAATRENVDVHVSS
jgi:hypothetical protein